MNKLTFGEAKDELAETLGMNVTDRRVMLYANRACRRLVDRGKWVGTTLRYQFCSNDGFITLPREIDTVELFALNTRPLEVRNEWYEMNENGPGILNSENCQFGGMLIDRGTACTFDDITRGTGILHKLQIVALVNEVNGAKITVRGYDNNNNWIRTQVAGQWIDGEQIVLKTVAQQALVLSVNMFSAVVEIIKPVTNGNIEIFEWDTVTAEQVKKIGIYEPDETLPVYRRYVVPGLENDTPDPQCSDGISKAVTVYCKLRCEPVANDNDFFLIGNLSALCYGAMAIKKEKQELPDEALKWWSMAVKALELELASYLGDGPLGQPRVQNGMVFGGGGVPNLL